jgi:hypothetical protein
MLLKSLALVLLVAPLALMDGDPTGQDDIGGRLSLAGEPSCPNLMAIEPIVLFNVSGATLFGPVQETLAVYDYGFVVFTRIQGAGLPSDDLQLAEDGSTRLTPRAGAVAVQLGISEAAQLVTDLHRAGARDLCDQAQFVTDVPLHTLTILDGRPNSNAHTFSYWAGVGNFTHVATVLDNFIEAYFSDL